MLLYPFINIYFANIYYPDYINFFISIIYITESITLFFYVMIVSMKFWQLVFARFIPQTHFCMLIRMLFLRMPVLRLSFLRLLILQLLLCALPTSIAQARNGFDLSEATIPTTKILPGGPPKDGIPSIDSPVFIAADKADFLTEDDLVMGVYLHNTARAYPIKILNWHEIVNDQINDSNFVVTFCPLCGSGVVFDAIVGSETLDFGVSGLLYNSDVLLYDRQTNSLWSQLLRQGVSGTYAHINLSVIPVQHTTWRHWQEQYPQTAVLSTDTGTERDYNSNPYEGYDTSEDIYFPVEATVSADFHPKEWVLGITANGKTKAYPFSQLAKNNQPQVRDNIGGQALTIHWNSEENSARAEWQEEDGGTATRLFWFAWFAFHPDSEIYKADE